MVTLDALSMSSEVSSKYSVVNSAFRTTQIENASPDSKGKPKDLITVEIGDTKNATKFYPQVKMCRWGDDSETNEVNFSIRLQHNEKGNDKVETIGDKIAWSKGNIQIKFYEVPDGEGAFKFVWYLLKKPTSNIVNFSIQSKNLNFFYQPPLTQEYQNGYSDKFQKEIIVSETQVKDLDGNVLAERPENVVGSYAVYHFTKGGMNNSYGKDYKVGKAFHIYRPHLIDANGLEAWGNLHIENGTYSVEIPQDFLDKAVYPIKSNDTFGYETGGGTHSYGINYADFSIGTPAGGNGTVTSLSIYSHTRTGSGNAKGVIWLVSTLAKLTNGITNAISVSNANDPPNNWNVAAFTTPPSVTDATNYYVGVILGTSGATFVHSDTSAGNGGYDSNNYNTPGNLSSPFDDATQRYSIYATYTPSAGGTSIKDIICCNGLLFPR